MTTTTTQYHVSWRGRHYINQFPTQSENMAFAQMWKGLYEVVSYSSGFRKVIYSKQY